MIGSEDQPVLRSKGDDHRIDWGYLYVTAPDARAARRSATRRAARRRSPTTASCPAKDDDALPARGADGLPSAAVAVDLGKVTDKRGSSSYVIVAYDDLLLDPVHEAEPAAVLAAQRRWTRPSCCEAAEKDYDVARRALREVRRRTDGRLREGRRRGLRADLRAGVSPVAGGAEARRRRQRQPLSFSKENFCNGCIATVDVIYPQLAVVPAASARRWPRRRSCRCSTTRSSTAGSSPSRRTTWARIRRPTARSTAAASAPKKNQMPVEESGNMLILLAAHRARSKATPTSPASTGRS